MQDEKMIKINKNDNEINIEEKVDEMKQMKSDYNRFSYSKERDAFCLSLLL